MSGDTQWPRYQVFTQSRPGSPFQDAGSVHAPDAELALLNARDVFARRPEYVAMWVIPVEAILTRSADELESERLADLEQADGSHEIGELYQIFAKTKAGGTLTWTNTQQAESPFHALLAALARLPALRSAFAWWVLPDKQITRSQAADYASLYQPAGFKTFRRSTDFHTISAMRKIKTANEADSMSDLSTS